MPIGIYDNNYNYVVCNSIGEKLCCLDVGCWTGNLGQQLVITKGCIVDGIDSDGRALIIAKERGYRNVYKINLNCEIISLPITYDVIICADVLEHLVNPLSVLKTLKQLLKKDGVIIISIPNVAFILQRILLFFGKFDYTPHGGIMDSTHLRFFTKKSIQQLCKDSGFAIGKFSHITIVKKRYSFLKLFAYLCPSLFAMQFLIVLRNFSDD